MAMLCTAIANKLCSVENTRARQGAFLLDIAIGIAALVIGVLAWKGKISAINSVIGMKMAIGGGIYTIFNVLGLIYLISQIPQRSGYRLGST